MLGYTELMYVCTNSNQYCTLCLLAPGVHSELVTFAGQKSLHYMSGCYQPLTIRVLKIFLIFVTVIAIQTQLCEW